MLTVFYKITFLSNFPEEINSLKISQLLDTKSGTVFQVCALPLLHAYAELP